MNQTFVSVLAPLSSSFQDPKTHNVIHRLNRMVCVFGNIKTVTLLIVINVLKRSVPT